MLTDVVQSDVRRLLCVSECCPSLAVESHWTKAKGSGTIIAVHRVRNEKQYRRFCAAGAALQHANTHAQLSMIVYHCTSGNLPWLICESDGGFDTSKGKAALGSVSSPCAEHAER